MAHALVHTADQHHQRRMRGQRQVAEGSKAEAECDGNAGENAETGDADCGCPSEARGKAVDGAPDAVG